MSGKIIPLCDNPGCKWHDKLLSHQMESVKVHSALLGPLKPFSGDEEKCVKVDTITITRYKWHFGKGLEGFLCGECHVQALEESK